MLATLFLWLMDSHTSLSAALVTRSIFVRTLTRIFTAPSYLLTFSIVIIIRYECCTLQFLFYLKFPLLVVYLFLHIFIWVKVTASSIIRFLLDGSFLICLTRFLFRQFHVTSWEVCFFGSQPLMCQIFSGGSPKIKPFWFLKHYWGSYVHFGCRLATFYVTTFESCSNMNHGKCCDLT